MAKKHKGLPPRKPYPKLEIMLLRFEYWKKIKGLTDKEEIEKLKKEYTEKIKPFAVEYHADLKNKQRKENQNIMGPFGRKKRKKRTTGYDR